ncbi:hypothetical protein [Pantoea ananatis]|uniref:hypothetical protein n=1 Tax=Pantoea ananas TaxID=553 RepID=UPI00048FC2BD|nr:hypothetical protein [Pantoea ananatis]
MKREYSSQPHAGSTISLVLRLITWLNISIHVAFPLAVAFTPVMAGAGEQHFLQQPAPLFAMPTEAYALGPGETNASVEKKISPHT